MRAHSGEDRAYEFTETPVKKLMQRRIQDVLLACSKYDRFMLEEDGRVDEQIFQEYVSLNLRYPPKFTLAYTDRDLRAQLESERFDLVISMLNTGGPDAVALATEVSERYPRLPVVLLTPASRGSAVDTMHAHVGSSVQQFAWLGDDAILLAIVKLNEDRMNADADVKAGIQVIVLVEDSVRYYSSYLPVIYRVLFQQARNLMEEGLNEWEQTMRMRCRPKILLATTFEEAWALCDKYRNSLLGVISDVSYQREGVEDPEAGLELCRRVRAENAFVPILLQSLDKRHRPRAEACGAGYLDKRSKQLLYTLRRYIRLQYGFGDILFRDPNTGEVVERASDLRELQHKIERVPDQSLVYHASRNDISRWLRARALFPLAEVFARRTLDRDNIGRAKEEIREIIAAYRRFESQGKIARFDPDRFDEYTSFCRVGNGSLGGKGRGLAFIDHSLKESRLRNAYEGVVISVPQTVVLSTDVFQQFMESNSLVDVVSQADPPDAEILGRFLAAELPANVKDDLRAILKIMRRPVAVRSSSLLEDSGYQPFAGIYKTYLLPNNAQTLEERLLDVAAAVKAVYASTFYRASRDYMSAVDTLVTEERMAVIIQEVTGTAYENRCYPSISGVARSLNYYAFDSERPEDGVVYAAIGLGRTVVEGRNCVRFSPEHPKKAMQLSELDTALRTTQKDFFAVSMVRRRFQPSTDEGKALELCDLSEARQDPSRALLVSTFDHANAMLRDGWDGTGRPVANLAGILKHRAFPLASILRDLLDLAKREMGVPVEIEFAVNLNPGEGQPVTFSFLQVRPVVEGSEAEDVDVEAIPASDALASSHSALGNGVYNDLEFVIYVRRESFDPRRSEEIATRIGSMNERVARAGCRCLLVAPGRLGSRDPWLGIPVAWHQIGRARVICELELEHVAVDPSQGSHFFHNITALRVGFATIAQDGDDFLDFPYLDALPALHEDEFVRLIDCRTSPIEARFDGRSRRAVIRRPAAGSNTAPSGSAP